MILITVTYVENDGTEHPVNAAAGLSLMQVAVENLVPGISADCGGACRCATCLCHVEEDWLAKLDAPSEDERLMLEGAMNSQPNSRLACQIALRPDLDGIRVVLPET
jgi:2Fe-2S ferredoxin